MYKYGIKKVEKTQIVIKNTWVNVCTTRNFAWFENMKGTIRSRKYFRPIFQKSKLIRKTWSKINLKRAKKFVQYLDENRL